MVTVKFVARMVIRNLDVTKPEETVHHDDVFHAMVAPPNFLDFILTLSTLDCFYLLRCKVRDPFLEVCEEGKPRR